MKELDKAIVNDDIKQIVFLIKNGVDSTGAVLIHLKDALVPEHFTEEQLVSKGALLTMDALKLAVPTYFQKSQTDYRYETYIKRLYLGSQRLLNAWESGSVQNQEQEQHFNQHAIQFLKAEWIANTLPETIAKFAIEKEVTYIDFKMQQWQQQSLSDKEASQLDKVVLDTLTSHWYQGDTQSLIVKKIQENQRQQLVEFYKHSKIGEEHFAEINQFLCKKVEEQIYNGSLKTEDISDAVVREKDLELKGAIKGNIMPEYRKGVRNLFVKWRANELDASTMEDVGQYVQKQLQTYSLPNELKDKLIKAAIEQLLVQYRKEQLSAELQNALAEQFDQSITDFYRLNATQASNFRDELGQAIFSQLLLAWKKQEMSADVATYLQVNLLADVQSIIQQLSLFVSRAAMFTLISQLQQDVQLLKIELGQIQTMVDEPKLFEASNGSLLSSQGVFRLPSSVGETTGSTEMEANSDQPKIYDERDMTSNFKPGMKN